MSPATRLVNRARRRDWVRLGLVLLLTLAVAAGVGLWRYDQRSLIAWHTIAVGESIERHGLLVEAISLSELDDPRLPTPDGAVWMESVIQITPTAASATELSCTHELLSGKDRWESDLYVNFEIFTNGLCGPGTGDPPLPVDEPRLVHSYWLVPQGLGGLRAKVTFFDPYWALAITP